MENKNKIIEKNTQIPPLGGEGAYIALYKDHHENIKKHSAQVMNDLRDDAFALFEKLGFPTMALENYKYTDLKDALSIDYGLNINRIPIPVNPYDVFKCDVPGITINSIFVNQRIVVKKLNFKFVF